jgi:hypothetical protein
MGSIEITLRIAERTTIVQSDWNEYRTHNGADVRLTSVIAEIQDTFQRLLAGARLGGEKPLRVTITQEEA